MGQIGELMQAYVDQHDLHELDGVHCTPIDGVYFYRGMRDKARFPMTYSSGIILMGQGSKNIYLGGQCMSYQPGTYLVVGVPLPLECEAFTDNGKPLLSVCIDVAPELLHRLVDQLQRLDVNTTPCASDLSCGLSAVTLPATMEAACMRLLHTMNNPIDAEVLGVSIVEEIVYRVLVGVKGHVLFDLARHDGRYARIARTLRQMHQDYAAPVTVESLAESANMSVSSFHRAFRQVTEESPLQYLKKVRLNRAKELITLEGKRASEAARLVGYTSPSQFSREYKRHFEATPKASAP